MPPFPRVPKRPVGYVPKRDFADGPGSFSTTKVGLIVRVDEVNMKADVKVLTGGGDRFEIDLTQAMAGPRSFWGGVPEVNSWVILGYRRVHKNLHEAVILGYIPSGNRSGTRFDPFSSYDPSKVTPDEAALTQQTLGGTTRFKRLLMRPGDVGGMSASGAELLLNEDIRMVNRAGDFLELRDAERTLVAQSVHRVEAESGVRRISGPIRRSKFFLPEDIFQADGKTLKDESGKYFGRDELQAAGPGVTPGLPPKYALTNGKVLDLFNNYTAFSPVTYANGRKVHYPPTLTGTNIENAESGSDAFVEHRMEVSHSSDLTQEVLEEIDGFEMDRRQPYIEQVFGTVIGNDFNTVRGQRQYAQVLKPKIFSDFDSKTIGKFQMEPVTRQATNDVEALTNAAAYLFRIRPPRSTGDNEFVYSVTKEGKIYLNVPRSTVENYTAKGVSAEINMAGAIKAFIGSSTPDRNSINAVLDGGIKAVIGHNADGRALDITYRSAVAVEYATTTPDDNDMAYQQTVRGKSRKLVTGVDQEQIASKEFLCDGGFQIHTDRLNVNSQQGFGGNFGEISWMVSGKSQYNYALQVLENIFVGGRISTILAGGLIQNITAGGEAHNIAAGGETHTIGAGGFTVSVGTGVISMTTGAGAVTMSTAAGALSLGAAAGAITLTAGLAVTVTAATLISLTAPQVLVGGPAAVLGVVRGVPALPPGTPSLDFILGLPYLGSATFRSLL